MKQQGFKKSRSVFGLLAIAAVLTLLMAWLLWYVAFPLDMLSGRAASMAEARGAKLEFIDLRKGLMPGTIKAGRIRLSSAVGAGLMPFALEADDLNVRFLWGSLFLLKPGAEISATMGGVPVMGSFAHSLIGGNDEVLLLVQKAPLTWLMGIAGMEAMGQYMGTRPGGSFSAEVASLPEGATEIRFALDDLALQPVETSGMRLPTERIKEGRALLRIYQDGAFEVVSANLSGKDLFVRATGRADRQHAEIKVEAMLEGLEDSDPLTMMLMPFKRPDGTYLIEYKR